MDTQEPVITISEEAIKIGDMVFPLTKKPVVPELADEVARILAEQGVTLDDLLAELERQRWRYREEKYSPHA